MSFEEHFEKTLISILSVSSKWPHNIVKGLQKTGRAREVLSPGTASVVPNRNTNTSYKAEPGRKDLGWEA